MTKSPSLISKCGMNPPEMDKSLDEKTSRLIYAAKGMAIFLVVLGHFGAPVALPPEWVAVQRLIYSFHMPLFMLLSGMLMAAVEPPRLTVHEYGRFLKKKITRLLVPYFSVTTLLLVAKVAAGRFFELQYPPGIDLWRQIFLCPASGFAIILWFIYTLFVIFLLYPPVKWLLRRDEVIWVVSLATTLLPWPDVFCLKWVFDFLPFFTAGILLYRHISWGELSRSRALWLALAATVLFGLSYILREHVPTGGATAVAIAGSVASLGWALVLVNSGISFLWERLGYWSAGIYFLHTLSMGPVKILLYQVTSWGAAHFLPTLFLSCLAGLAIPVLLEKFVLRRYPLLARLILGIPGRRL